MEAVFIKLLNMSITAGWLILAVVLFRFLFKKAPKWMNYVLWALVAIRLVCPISFESAFSLIPSTETVSWDIVYEDTPEIQSGSDMIDEAVNPLLSAVFSEGEAEEQAEAEKEAEVGMTIEIEEKEAPAAKMESDGTKVQTVFQVLSVIWILGVAVLILYAFISYYRLGKKVQEAVLLEGNIWQCDNIGTAFILGVIRPRIYIPSALEGKPMECVIAHERSHIKCLDHLWKPVGFAILTVYWFNPLVWAAYILMCKDIEIACDERVVKNMNVEEKKAYSHALLECSLPRHMVSACPVAFGEVGVKTRVKSVLRYKKPAVWISVIAIVVCLFSLMGFLTDPTEYSGQEQMLWVEYRMDVDGTDEENGVYKTYHTPCVKLFMDYQFSLSYEDSTLPYMHGTYRIDGNELILEGEDNNRIIFRMKDGKLIYKEDGSYWEDPDNLWWKNIYIEDGAAFSKGVYYTENNIVAKKCWFSVPDGVGKYLDNETLASYDGNLSFSIVVRYYDKAGNYTEMIQNSGDVIAYPDNMEDYVLRTILFYDVDMTSRSIGEEDREREYPETIKVMYAYEWLDPSMGKNDSITVSWSDNNFDLVEGSFKKIDKYTVNGIEFVTEYGTEYTGVTDTSITWDVNLQGKNYDPERLYGSGSFEIVPKEELKKAGIMTIDAVYSYTTLFGGNKEFGMERDWKWYLYRMGLEDYGLFEDMYGEWIHGHTFSNNGTGGETVSIKFNGWEYSFYPEGESEAAECGYYCVEDGNIVLTSQDGSREYVFTVAKEGLIYQSFVSDDLCEISIEDGTLFIDVTE